MKRFLISLSLVSFFIAVFLGGRFLFFSETKHSFELPPAAQSESSSDWSFESRGTVHGSEANSGSGARQETEIMAWIYPGEPACGARAEYSDGRRIDILKAEYFTVDQSGALVLLTETDRGCNAFSRKNVDHLRMFSKEQYATVSSSYAGSMDRFLSRATEGGDDIRRLTEFAVANRLTGIELDFEDFGGWSRSSYDRYKGFVRLLGESLRAEGKRLMIDGPAISSDEEAAWFPWNYADFTDLPVDWVVVMAYDYQFDHGAGNPVAPLEWIDRVVRRTRDSFSDASRLSFGIPSYGYRGEKGTSSIRLLTHSEASALPGFSSALRDAGSAERVGRNGTEVVFFQDSTSMDEKRAIIERAGVSSVSVWHLGGNEWFSDTR